jgi:hypothetical protein
MLTVETIGKIRLKHKQGGSIRGISRELKLSRNTVRKVLRGDQTEFNYQRSSQPYPKLGPFIKDLEAFLEQDKKLSKKRRRTVDQQDQENHENQSGIKNISDDKTAQHGNQRLGKLSSTRMFQGHLFPY